MSTSNPIRIRSGPDEFILYETEYRYGDIILNKSIKIGGDHDNCVGVSIMYRNNKPISAKIPHAQYEPECSDGSTLKSGIGSINMVKTLLRYMYEKTTISKVMFDDMSHIDCGTPEELKEKLKQPPPRKNIKPLKLSYFSIAYHSKTWYELYFNATMYDETKYRAYRERLAFLTDPKPDFSTFLSITTPPIEDIKRLEIYYDASQNYREFFEKIPKNDRCDLLSPWLVSFMTHYLKGVFSDNEWQINIVEMDKQDMQGGVRKKSRRKTLKHPYPAHYKIIQQSDIHTLL